MCHDNFQLARVKIKRQKSIFLYNRIQIEKKFYKIGGQFKAPYNLLAKKYILKHILINTCQTLI